MIMPGDMRKNRSLKTVSLAVLIVFSIYAYILPPLSAITVEEQAGGKTMDSIRQPEEGSGQKAAPGRARSIEEKDPRLACLLSLIIPGGGQIYLKQDINGVTIFSLAAAGYSAGGYFLYTALTGDLSGAEKKSKIILSGSFFFLGAIFHTIGIVRAYNDAIEINEKNYYYGGFSRFPHIAELELK